MTINRRFSNFAADLTSASQADYMKFDGRNWIPVSPPDVEKSYKNAYTGDLTGTTFRLPHDDGTEFVYINGVLQSDATYTSDPVNNLIVFDAAPGLGSEIQLRGTVASTPVATFRGDYDAANPVTLLASDAQASDQYAVSCALSADASTLVVGAIGEDTATTDAGKLYVYQRQADGTYGETAQITASDAQATDRYAISCALSADASTLVVGAYIEDTAASNAGKLYVYQRQADGTYGETAQITASDAQATDRYAGSCALSADASTLVVGAYEEDTAASNAGKLYVYQRQADGTYGETAQITASDAQATDQYAFSCALSADASTLVVGASTEDTATTDAGKLYVYQRQADGTYGETAQITASDAQATDRYARSCALSADASTLVVGASTEDTATTDAGKLYVYQRQADGTYGETAQITASDAQATDRYAGSCALSADASTLVVGASTEDTAATDAGKIYIYGPA